MNALSEAIGLLRTKGQVYGRLEFVAPWGFDFPGDKGICLMVTRGSCFLSVDREEPATALREGDFVFLASPRSYALRSHRDLPVRPMQEEMAPETFHRKRAIHYRGSNDGESTSLIAGCFRFATPESEWLAGRLPSIIHVSATGAHSPHWFRATLDFIDTEISQSLPGADSVIDRLAEVLFVQAIRTRIIAPGYGDDPGWLRALADPQIAEALGRIHSEPGYPWTVPELARTSSMSRSAFAARFRHLIGKTPLEYLTQWRMVRAAGMIREGRNLKIATVASAVGYESEAAFGKVFRRVVGVPPGRYRQTSG